jgi:hypothetical protein
MKMKEIEIFNPHDDNHDNVQCNQLITATLTIVTEIHINK